MNTGSHRRHKERPGAGASESGPPSDSSAEATPFCPVAGFGASAGGLEAFTDVLRHLPEDTGLAIVFIQHLDPKHTSVLSELLSRATRMPVLPVTDGMRVEANRIHVIPPNTNITISGGVLHLEARPAHTPHMPIDHFLRSLAADQGSKAAGIVLSGTASDGTLGLKAIKAEGGITFAQLPESARYEGMPRSAIAAGCVDVVLPPQGIAAELARLCRHPYLSPPHGAAPSVEPDGVFNEIFAMLRAATGVDFMHYKPGTIRRRTLRRIALQKLETPEQYLRYLKEHREELEVLFQDLLIHVTGFFREPETFTAIRTQLLPALLKGRSPEDTLRVWVPGCSSGEEVYSVAMCLLEPIWEARIEVPVQVFGTDLSEAALQKARAGLYPESIAADVSAEQLRRFFVRSDGSYQIARPVRDVCIFARQNVTKDPPFSKLDLITCRNLLIYLGPVLQSRVMRLFHYALKPSGYLILGASEHTGKEGETYFQTLDRRHRIYVRKPLALTVPADFGGYEESRSEPSHKAAAAAPEAESQARVDRLLLARYAPPAVVADRNLQVLQFRGDISAYLGHTAREASLNLMKLARGGLGPEIRGLLDKCIETGVGAKGETLMMGADNQARKLRISVTPVPGLGDQFLVVFEGAPATEPQPPAASAPANPKTENERLKGLEQELINTREYLQSVIEEQEVATEELKSAHEEVQSSNEELQSTNEELLTAKEELQSTNEELTTVNEEMQNRNQELQQANNDLINLLSSVNIPIMMLGSDLRIRRFNPQAEKILNLIPSDVGRPIGDFRLKIHVPDLAALCHQVVDTLVSKEREVEDGEGHIYSMWIRPYRTTDHRIEGVVIALLDVTERKRVAEARYRRMFEAAKYAIVVADAASGEIVDANPFTTKLFGYSRSELVGTRFWESDLFRNSDLGQSLLAELQEQEIIQKTVALADESGERMEAEVFASLYTEGERKVIQFNLRDMRSSRRLEERLRRSEDQARQAQKMEAVGRLAGGMAHNFNNILTTVLGNAELLEGMLAKDHPGRAMLEQIEAGAERAAAITRQLLAFGRKQVVRPAVLNPNVVILEMRQMLLVMMSENIQLVTRLDPQAGWIRADRAQVEQIVLNLALNARDASAHGGTITISTANLDVDEGFSEKHPTVAMGRYVSISVEDTGMGMDEETKSHLFEPFFTTKIKGGGAGLGLATVHNIVKQNGGYIWAYSEWGVGSTFTVYLPRLAAEAAAGGKPEAEARVEPRQGTETVLVVEDEHPIRLLVRRFLEARGYRVLEAGSGPEAMRIAREHSGVIHLMVTDVEMPRMSGREVAFQLASERPDMKVLYMSGHTEDTIVDHGIVEQGLAFLSKPFTQEGLLDRVRALLDGGGDGTPESSGPGETSR